MTTHNFKDLQKKAENAFDKFYQKYRDQMSCSEGCSRCCVEGLTVFSWEAAIISDWFFDLSPEQQSRWKMLQEKPQTQMKPFLNGSGLEAKPCAFLREDKCSIYEVRPSLCRTHGMAFRFQAEKEEVLRDWCPLNFSGENSKGPEDADDLNLDTLNQMLATAQILHEKESPESLGPQRVDLQSLWYYLSKL